MKVALLTTDSRECFRDYAAPRPYYGTAVTALLQGLAMMPEVDVHVLSCTQERLSPEEQLAPNIRAYSLFVPKLGWLRTGYQGCIRTMRQKLKQIQPDIVHGQGTERDCAISAVFSGYCSLVTLHGNIRLIAKLHRAKPGTYLWFTAKLERFTVPRANGVICLTNYSRNAVSELARKTWLVPNAVDKQLFELRRAPQSRPIILCVGDVSFHKNQNVLIRALDDLAERRSFVLHFLGRTNNSTSYGREFRRLVEQRDWCMCEGFANRNKLKTYLERATLLVLPSLQDNCPMVVLEAMASGIPVIAASVGGVPELIENDQTGLLFDPTSSESIRAALSKILDRPDMAAKMANNAREIARDRFHPRVIAHEHVKIYEETCALKYQSTKDS